MVEMVNFLAAWCYIYI